MRRFAFKLTVTVVRHEASFAKPIDLADCHDIFDLEKGNVNKMLKVYGWGMTSFPDGSQSDELLTIDIHRMQSVEFRKRQVTLKTDSNYFFRNRKEMRNIKPGF